MKSLTKLAILGVLLTACGKSQPNAGRPVGAAAVDDANLAILLKSHYEEIQDHSGLISTNVVAPANPPDVILDCPTSGTIELSSDFNEETYEYRSVSHANMCADGETFVDGDLIFSSSGFELKNFTSRSNFLCEFFTSTTNGTIIPLTGGTLGADADVTISYSEAPENILNHTFNLVSHVEFIFSGQIYATGTGSITREDGLNSTYQVTAGEFTLECAEGRVQRAYLEFSTSQGSVIRYEDTCFGEEKLLIDGREVTTDSGCT